MMRLFTRQQDPRENLVQALGEQELPSFPALVWTVLEKLRAPEGSLQEVGRLLAADPGLSVRLLRTVNAAGTGLRRQVNNVPHAVMLLGRRQVEAMVLAVAVRDALPVHGDGGFDSTAFWQTAAHRAVSSYALARVVEPAIAELSFTAALLQDMALPLLTQRRPESYARLVRA